MQTVFEDVLWNLSTFSVDILSTFQRFKCMQVVPWVGKGVLFRGVLNSGVISGTALLYVDTICMLFYHISVGLRYLRE